MILKIEQKEENNSQLCWRQKPVEVTKGSLFKTLAQSSKGSS